MEKNEKSKETFFERNKIKIIIITAIIIQTVIFIIAGINKSYFHIDESYSFGLASYDKGEIINNEDFYNNWHNKDYYKDYLVVNDDEIFNFSQVYTNQIKDVHPPLFYFLLRIFMSFSVNKVTKWGGLILNIILYAFITLFVYLILNKLFKDKAEYKIKLIIIAFISSITIASMSNMIFIRMYTLYTLNILIITYLHIKLIENFNKKTLVLIGLSAVIGSLTHYYYLYFLLIQFLVVLISFIKNKEKKKAINYIITFVIAAIVSLAIFPFSIQHLFSGYRGKETFGHLLNFRDYINRIIGFIGMLQKYSFNNTLILILGIIIGIIIYRKKKKINNKVEISEYFKIVYIPTIISFILIAISATSFKARFIYPVSAISFISVFYILNQLLESVTSKEKIMIIMSALIILIILSPILTKTEPREMYSRKKELVNKFKNELNVPTIYWFDSKKAEDIRFLDDILLFSLIDESYMAKDIECNKENINKILENKDISKGIVIFLFDGQDENTMLDTIRDTTSLETITFIEKSEFYNIYYMK